MAKSQKDNAALLAHERCHQSQQRRDGWLVFWWRYLTNKSHRLAYEVEAYRVWLRVSPHDAWRVSAFLARGYSFDLTQAEAFLLLTQPKDTAEAHKQ